MEKADIVIKIKQRATERIINGVDKLVDDLVAEVEREISELHTQNVEKIVLGNRKKYAETEEVMSETGMSLQEIREFNAYSDGYNARGSQLRKKINGDDVRSEAEVVTPAVPAEVVPEVVAEEVIAEETKA